MGALTDANVVRSPFGGERLSELNNTSLRGIVAALLLRPIYNVPRHGCNEDDRSASLLFNHDPASGLCAKEGSGKVDIDKPSEFLDIVCLGWDVGTIFINNSSRSLSEVHLLCNTGGAN